MKSRYVCIWSANVGDIDRNKLRFGYSGMRFQIRVSIQGSGIRISGYLLRSLSRMVRFNHEDRVAGLMSEVCPFLKEMKGRDRNPLRSLIRSK